MNGSGYETVNLLENALPIIEASHRVLANNIANANTPGFTPTRVSFMESLRQAMAGSPSTLTLEATSPLHITQPTARPALVLEPDTFGAGRNDRSKFNVDREMVELLKNSNRFDILSGILRNEYQQMRQVLTAP